MRDAWSTWGHVVVATVCAVPVAALAVLLLTRRRARRGHPAPLRTSVADVVMVAGTAPWIWMILTPGVEEGVHVVPLVDLAGQLALLSPGAAVVQIGGNLLVFAALGAMLPVRSARFGSPAAVAAVAATASLTVELLQFGLRLGRVSSVDDVLLNAAGAVLAALCTRRWWARRTGTR
ncbi:VanZ family protein [Microbispora hainanensis]|uniref:VanZ family protein n=1 Tax=Microbispora hainanensis TaxID=568844 RepID=A0ABZ1SH62_9ACTN|nr:MULTISPECIES: VanZ family protein [Microbispora]NJP29154.1 VanZ family protein [Microbispora sp. CL1-1]TQS06092.1 VanZ family protein [Microbispora sp. SCL1-1]